MESHEELFDRGTDVVKNFATTCPVSLDPEGDGDEATIDVRGRDFAYVDPDSLRQLADAIEETEPADDGDVLAFTDHTRHTVTVHEDDIVAIKESVDSYDKYGDLAVHFTREHPESDNIGARTGPDETRPEDADCSWTFDEIGLAE